MKGIMYWISALLVVIKINQRYCTWFKTKLFTLQGVLKKRECCELLKNNILYCLSLEMQMLYVTIERKTLFFYLLTALTQTPCTVLICFHFNPLSANVNILHIWSQKFLFNVFKFLLLLLKSVRYEACIKDNSISFLTIPNVFILNEDSVN